MSCLRKQFSADVEKVAGSQRVFRFVASDEKPDRVGDIISVEGWDTSEFEKNPIILFAHRSMDLPVGKAVRVHRSGRPKQLLVDVEFAKAEDYAFAGTVSKLVENGFLKAVSVGFRSMESEPIDKDDDSFFAPRKFLKQELLELSVVPVPCNPRALAVTNALDRRLMRSHQLLEKMDGLCGYFFTSEKYKPADVERWMTEHGYEPQTDVIKEFKRGYFYPTLSTQVDPSFGPFERVDVGDGVTALFTEIEKTQPVNVPTVFTNGWTVGTSTTIPTITYTNSDTTAQTKMLGELKSSIDNLATTVKELAVLAELAAAESDPPAPGKQPVGDMAEEYEKQIADLSCGLKALLT